MVEYYSEILWKRAPFICWC